MSNLTKKEKLFCEYYITLRNPQEAAFRAGLHFPAVSWIKTLKKEAVREYIKRLEKRQAFSNEDVLHGLYRLAFGSANDAVRLIFDESLDESQVEKLDLFNVSEIKRPKGGGIEVKFCDRLKALEKLGLALSPKQKASDFSIYAAIEKSAEALGACGNE